MGEGVLEGVLDLGEEAGLVEELGGLQMREAQAEQASSGISAMAWRSARGTSVPMTAAACRRRFLLGWQPVDARRQDRLHRGRHLHARRALARR